MPPHFGSIRGMVRKPLCIIFNCHKHSTIFDIKVTCKCDESSKNLDISLSTVFFRKSFFFRPFQAFLTPKAINPLRVDLPTFSSQQDGNSTITKTWMFSNQLMDLADQPLRVKLLAIYSHESGQLFPVRPGNFTGKVLQHGVRFHS